MSIITTIKRAVTGIIAYAAIACTSGCAKPEIMAGANNLEAAVEASEDTRVRAINNIDVKIDEFAIGYHGLNECSNMDGATYFGKNPVSVGPIGSPVRAEVCAKTASDGVIDTKYGVRDTSIVRNLGGYGCIEALANKDAANISIFYGRALPKGCTLEVLQSVDIPFDGGKAVPYTEIQLNKSLGKHAAAFVRAEVPDFDTAKGKYLVGVALTK